jgi:hypothetical protein
VKRASPTLGTSHAYGSGTSVLVLGRHALLPSPPGMTRWSYEEYHTTPVLRRSAVGHWDGATGRGSRNRERFAVTAGKDRDVANTAARRGPAAECRRCKCGYFTSVT